MDGAGKYRSAGFLVSDTEDSLTTEIFLAALMHASPDSAAPNVAVTDDTSIYPGAIRAVYGEDCAHLLCWWHVGKTWVKNLSAKLPGTSQERGTLIRELYKKLGVLRDCPDVANFHRGLSRFLSDKRESVKDFLKYFKASWSTPEQVRCIVRHDQDWEFILC